MTYASSVTKKWPCRNIQQSLRLQKTLKLQHSQAATLSGHSPLKFLCVL
jgi:hypothetical protein